MLSTPRRRFAFMFLLGALAFAALVLSLQAIWTIRDCTAPSGSCQRQQQQRTRELVATTRQIIVAAAECSVQLNVEANTRGTPLDAAQIGTCVDHKLRTEGKKP